MLTSCTFGAIAIDALEALVSKVLLVLLIRHRAVAEPPVVHTIIEIEDVSTVCFGHHLLLSVVFVTIPLIAHTYTREVYIATAPGARAVWWSVKR